MKKSYLTIITCLVLALCSVFAVGCKDNNGGGEENPIQTPSTVVYALAFDGFSMINGQTLTLDARLLADGALAEGELSYSSSDSSVISIANGVASANKLGNADITVTAALGDKGKVAEKTVTCSVTTNAGIVTNQHAYTVYITDKIHGTTFNTTSQLQAEVFIDGIRVSNPNVSWQIGDSSIATISQSGLISAVKVGKTYVVGSYQEGSNQLKTVNIPVEVAVPVLSTDMNVIIDVTQSEYFIDSNSILGNGKVVSKIVNSETLVETPVDSGMVPTAGFRTGEYRYVVYDKNCLMGCEVNLIVADYVVDSKSDFMQLHSYYDSDYIAIACDLKSIGGYSCPVDSGKFDGVFNGLGHTISGLTVNAYGIFNDASDGAVFKNVSFTDVTIEGSNSAVFYFRGSGNNYFENVHLEIKSISSNAWGSGTLLAFCFNGTVNVKNCIIEAKGNIGDTCGAVLGRSSGSFIYDNFYVISRANVCGTGQHTWNRKYDELNKLSVTYKTREDFIAERYAEDSLIDLSSFNGYWDLAKDVPTFK